jgi:hypothetical protein
MAYKSPAKRARQKKKHILGVILIVVALGIAGFFGWLRFSLESQKIELDPVTLCPVSGSKEHIAIVFDKSDAYNEV